MIAIRGRKGNYPYACARIRAKKSLLLTKDNYPKLLMMDLNEIGRFLGETQYQVEMAELASKYSGVDLIEIGTSRNLARIYRQVLGFCSGELKDMVSSYLARWDEWNVKTILRGKYYGAMAEDIIEDLVPAGRLDEEYLRSLISMETVPEVLDAVSKKGGAAIPSEVRAAYEETGVLEPLEDYFDKVYFSRLLESIRGKTRPEKLFLAFIRKEIDINNLRTLLHLKKEGIPFERVRVYFIDGGKELKVDELVRLAGIESFEQMVDELSRFSFYEGIKEALEVAKQTESLTKVMLALQKYLAKEAEKFSHQSPLSILPILDYMIRKKVEVDNIRIIARGKESGLDADVIKGLLVM
ncbi:MAG: ATP synthase A1 subunit C [Methanomassiliicoccales archaeon]|nr:ATP synthase A1 subunit C [Methanomassiliicoccales archaeon]